MLSVELLNFCGFRFFIFPDLFFVEKAAFSAQGGTMKR